MSYTLLAINGAEDWKIGTLLVIPLFFDVSVKLAYSHGVFHIFSALELFSLLDALYQYFDSIQHLIMGDIIRPYA